MHTKNVTLPKILQMKRTLIFTLLISLLVTAKAQTPVQVTQPYQYNKYVNVLDSLISKNISLPRQTSFPTPKRTGQLCNKLDTIYYYNGTTWIKLTESKIYSGSQTIIVRNDSIIADTTNKGYSLITKTQLTAGLAGLEPPAGGYANNLYLDTLTSVVVPTYKTLTYTPSLNTYNQAMTVNSSEGDKLIATFIYPTGVGETLYPSGLWSFNFYGSVSSASGVSQIGIQYFKRSITDVETNLFTIWSSDIENITNNWIKFNTTQPTFTVAETDRMGARLYVRTTSVANRTITVTIGDGYGSYVGNPNRIRHSQLRALDGDTSFLHVTATEKNTWNNKLSASGTAANSNLFQNHDSVYYNLPLTRKIKASDTTRWAMDHSTWPTDSSNYASKPLAYYYSTMYDKGNDNYIWGHSATSLTTGSSNIAIGVASNYSLSNGIGNVSVGPYSLLSYSNNSNLNSAYGFSALQSWNGSNNIALGAYAGANGNSTLRNNRLIINSINRNDANSDTTKAIIYGLQDNSVSNQRLDFNVGKINLPAGATINVGGTSIIPDTASEWVSRTIYVSLPNDPQTPGSDLTGDGSSIKPFATLEKALSTVKQRVYALITIQLDSGKFTYTRKCSDFIRSIFLGANSITIQGQVPKQYITGITFSAVAGNPYEYTATVGGSNPNWTYNQLDEYLCQNSTNYYFIEGNISNMIYTNSAGLPTGNLFKLETILEGDPSMLAPMLYNSRQISNGQNIGLNYNYLTFSVDVSSSAFVAMGRFSSNACYYIYTNCLFKPKSNGTLSYYALGNGFYSFIKSYLKKNSSATAGLLTFLGAEPPLGTLTYTILKNIHSSKAGYAIDGGLYQGQLLLNGGNNIFSNFDYGINKGTASIVSVSSSIMFRKCNNVFNVSTIGSYNSMVNLPIYLDSTSYLFNFTTNIQVGQIRMTLTGSPTSGIWNSSSTIKYLYGPNADIRFTGAYPEQDLKLSATLANNSTDSISIGDKSYNRSIEIKTNITRGTDYQYKRIIILNTGTALTMVQQPDSIQTADLGVRIDGVYYSGNSNTIKLKWHTTDTGSSSTFTYDAIRQNY